MGIETVKELSFEVIDADDSEYDEEQYRDNQHVKHMGNCHP